MLKKKTVKKIGRLLVIGVGGYMGNFYMKCLLELGIHPEQIIGVDIDPKHLQQISKKYPGPIYTQDHEEALRLKPRAAINLVNSPAHLQEIKRCYKAGLKKIFTEKPLVYTLEELTALSEHDNSMLYTAYLINFSGIVKDLFSFMRKENLAVVQAFSKWGKNWPAVPRPMGGDAEEEMPHPLALILSTIGLNQKINNVKSYTRLTNIPHVQPHLLEEAKKLELGFPDILNDSTLADFEITTDTGVVNAHLTTSFNFTLQNRIVEISFKRREESSNLPLYKAFMEFDVNPFQAAVEMLKIDEKTLTEAINKKETEKLKQNTDILKVINARTDETVFANRYTGNKLLEQMACALKAFAGDGVDSRLVNFDHSSWLVRLLLESISN